MNFLESSCQTEYDYDDNDDDNVLVNPTSATSLIEFINLILQSIMHKIHNIFIGNGALNSYQHII